MLTLEGKRRFHMRHAACSFEVTLRGRRLVGSAAHSRAALIQGQKSRSNRCKRAESLWRTISGWLQLGSQAGPRCVNTLWISWDDALWIHKQKRIKAWHVWVGPLIVICKWAEGTVKQNGYERKDGGGGKFCCIFLFAWRALNSFIWWCKNYFTIY